jgi:hypothetical protein
MLPTPLACGAQCGVPAGPGRAWCAWWLGCAMQTMLRGGVELVPSYPQAHMRACARAHARARARGPRVPSTRCPRAGGHSVLLRRRGVEEVPRAEGGWGLARLASRPRERVAAARRGVPAAPAAVRGGGGRVRGRRGGRGAGGGRSWGVGRREGRVLQVWRLRALVAGLPGQGGAVTTRAGYPVMGGVRAHGRGKGHISYVGALGCLDALLLGRIGIGVHIGVRGFAEREAGMQCVVTHSGSCLCGGRRRFNIIFVGLGRGDRGAGSSGGDRGAGVGSTEAGTTAGVTHSGPWRSLCGGSCLDAGCPVAVEGYLLGRLWVG